LQLLTLLRGQTTYRHRGGDVRNLVTHRSLERRGGFSVRLCTGSSTKVARLPRDYLASLLYERHVASARTETCSNGGRNVVRAGDTAIVRMVLVDYLLRGGYELVLGSGDSEGLVFVVKHTSTATFVRLNLSTLCARVLATTSNLEGDGRGLNGVRATGYQGRHCVVVLDKRIVLSVDALRVGRTI
jgi:hypothetical protein